MEPKWLDIAQHEAGVREKPGKATEPRVLDYFKAAGHPEIHDDETAWCSAFVNFCLETAGYRGTMSLAARSWLRWGKSIKGALVPGAILIFPRGGNDWQGHVTILKRILPNGNLLCLGGNQRNMVGEQIYRAEGLLDARWPNTMGNSKTVAMMGGGGTSSLLAFVSEQASEVRYFSEQAQEYWSLAGYVALAATAVCLISGIIFKYRDLERRG
jgi:uncharacterized protein (TIGR02594 family)